MPKKFNEMTMDSRRQVQAAQCLSDARVSELVAALLLGKREGIEIARENSICAYEDYLDCHIENYLLESTPRRYSGQT